MNCTKIARHSPGQAAYEIFGIERTFLTIWVSTSEVQGVFCTEASNLDIPSRYITAVLHVQVYADCPNGRTDVVARHGVPLVVNAES